MDLDDVGLESALQWRDGLHQQWVGVTHVKVHEAGHGQPCEHTLDRLVDLAKVVLFDRGGDELLLGLPLKLVWLFKVLKSLLLILLENLVPSEKINQKSDKGGQHV